MNRRTRTLIVLGVALASATVATIAVVLIILRNRPEPPKTEKVVVAARAVAASSCLTEDDIKVVDWPVDNRPQAAIADQKVVLSRSLSSALSEGDPLSEAKLHPKEAGCGLPPSIEAGMRAISVKVNEVIGVAGFVVPGTLVDVVVTIRQNNDSFSRVVVSQVKVMAAGTGLDQEKAKDGKPMPATVVTLMVTPSDAEKIALAATEGQILLTLRNPLDKAHTRTAGVRTPELFARTEPARTPTDTPPPVVRSYRSGGQYEVIRAGERRQGTYR